MVYVNEKKRVPGIYVTRLLRVHMYEYALHVTPAWVMLMLWRIFTHQTDQ